VWSQAPASVGLARDASGTRCDCERIQAVSLLNDFTFTAAKKPTEPAGDPERSPDPIDGVTMAFRPAPLFSHGGALPDGHTQRVRRVTLGLPLSCGPPARI
jgi:hypothetical protein